MAVTLVTNSKSVVNELSGHIMRDTVGIIATGILYLRDRSASIVNIVGTNKLTQRVLTTNFIDLENTKELTSVWLSMLKEDQDFTTIVCITRDLLGYDPRATNSNVQTPPYSPTNPYGPVRNNYTTYMVGSPEGVPWPFTNYTTLWDDYDQVETKRVFLDFDNPGEWKLTWQNKTQEVYTPVSYLRYQPGYLDMMSDSPSKNMYYITIVYNNLPCLITARNFWFAPFNDPVLDVHPPMFCTAVTRMETASVSCKKTVLALKRILFKKSKPTNDSVVFMFEHKTGQMLAAESLTSVVNPDGWKLYTPTTTNDTNVRKIGLALERIYTSLTNVPTNNGEYMSVTTEIDGEAWFVNTQYFAAPPNDWLLVVALPRSDFYGTVDKAQRSSIIIAVIIAIVGSSFVSFMAFIALRPLHHLAVSMEQLTKFDFSSLEGGILDNRSLVQEIRHVQATFGTMINAL
ncbi:hypothetical protein HK104_002456 [Borealophlyctis nickersoniae]|nr:hypothetical protein HK104_002456 [Borealophlyctis nickersoniae]